MQTSPVFPPAVLFTQFAVFFVADYCICETQAELGSQRFLSRVSILMRDIDIAIMSACPSRSGILCKRLNIIVTVSSPHGGPIILIVWVSNSFAKFQRALNRGSL